jgi:hypothetical protein
MLSDIAKIETYDPEYLQVMIDHAQTVMVNRQLAIAHRTDLFDTILTEVNKKITRALLPVWAEYLGLYDQTQHRIALFKTDAGCILYTPEF